MEIYFFQLQVRTYMTLLEWTKHFTSQVPYFQQNNIEIGLIDIPKSMKMITHLRWIRQILSLRQFACTKNANDSSFLSKIE